MPKPSAEENIVAIYATLAKVWGRQHWWPAKSRFEVIVGAYLTQNTSWRNVEIARRTSLERGRNSEHFSSTIGAVNTIVGIFSAESAEAEDVRKIPGSAIWRLAEQDVC
jgi:hypothetical protein